MELARWFRKHERYLLAGLVVMLMVSWGILGTAQTLLRRAEAPMGEIQGRKVSAAEMHGAVTAVRAGAALGLLDSRILGRLPYVDTSPETAAAVVALVRDLQSFVFEEEKALDTRSAWRMLVVLRDAEAEGVAVTQKEAADLLALSPMLSDENGVNDELFRQFLDRYEFTESDLNAAVIRLATVGKLLALRREAAGLSRAELWAVYVRDAEQRRVRGVAVDGAWFDSLVSAPPDAVRELYEKHKDQFADAQKGQLGYMAPQRARMEWADIRVESLMAPDEVTAEQIGAHYEANKGQYLEKLPEGQGSEASAESESGSDKAPEGYRYKSLEEARETIREELARREAERKVDELVRKAMDEMADLGERYANEPLPLAQIARRHGMEYHVAVSDGGGDLLSREEVSRLVPLGGEVAEFAFASQESTNYPRVFKSPEQAVICQVLEVREPELQPFELVSEKVREDYVRQEALERATAFAQNLREAAGQEGLAKAVESMGERLRALLAESADASQAQLKVQESDKFTRNARAVLLLEGTGPDSVEKSFELALGGLTVSREGPPSYRSYVLELIEITEAPPDRFALQEQLYHMLYLPERQSTAVREWLRGLLAASPRPEAEG